ncbi:MAG: oxygen-dependent coproporphyrinogen oxidase [Rhodospirillales bacterium]|nr:oxygen-dependent coproporphyrinogen oxidase [Rhodospirillales bacterium]
MSSTDTYGTESHKKRAMDWFSRLRDDLCMALELIETDVEGPNGSSDLEPGVFQRKSWQRPAEDGTDGGGGTMAVMRGRVLEKAGVNISEVKGEFSPEFRKNIPGAEADPRFWAAGISVVIHPRSPLVPAAHMNTRMIVTQKAWFGGGGDLTPVFPDDEETALFHRAYKDACDRFDGSYYPKYKKACDEYFYLPHRDEPRGVGGIFVDNLNSGDWESDFGFIQEIGRSFMGIYPQLVRRAMDLPWTAAQKQAQLIKRGRYVEFNLLHDRGTLFGIKTGGNTEAILMSMPPEVHWP